MTKRKIINQEHKEIYSEMIGIRNEIRQLIIAVKNEKVSEGIRKYIVSNGIKRSWERYTEAKNKLFDIEKVQRKIKKF
jgi:hypothetical protein